MKIINFVFFFTVISICTSTSAVYAQSYVYHASKEFMLKHSAENTFISVYNVAGNIRVEGYNGDKVTITAEEKITAANQKDVLAGKNEFKLGFDQKGDSLVVYTAAPFDSRPHDESYTKKEIKIAYHFLANYVIRVPFGVNLHLSTVNDGNIIVRNVTGSLNISDINGSISIVNAKGKTQAYTINGNLIANYLGIPPEACSYYTLNGKLEVTYPKDLSANIQVKTINGSVFTDFDQLESLPTKAITTTEKKEVQTQFKLEKNNEFKVGKGGKLFKFETFNGNIFIKKKTD